MVNSQSAPIFTTLFDSPGGDDTVNRYYRDVVLLTLKKVLPSEFFDVKENLEETCRHQNEILKNVTPLICHSAIKPLPGMLSFFSLSKYRANSFKFFFEMISRWLTLGQRLDVVLVYATDFRLTHLSEGVYTICEVMISITDQAVLDDIQRNFPILESEIALGMLSDFYAQRILEIKGLSADDKTASIQSFIARLVKRFPGRYDNDVFTEMQHVLVSCRDDFKAARQSRHLSRMINLQYLFRRGLREAIKKNPHKRHLHLNVFRTTIRSKGKLKRVVGISFGINFIRDQENFEERNLMKAIELYFPFLRVVEDSFLIHKFAPERISLCYIEVEKKDESFFSPSEMRRLKRELPGRLKNCIEYRPHTVFMPRNEEEVMRNLVTLTNQIRYVRDIPQVAITFDEQTYSDLYFTVILARLLTANTLPIAELFKKSTSGIEYLHDRTKIMGHVRKKYPKEATVFRLKLPKENFLRRDHSIDLSKGRQAVVNELLSVIGEFRDFNGGMILKQHELLSAIRELLLDAKDHEIKNYDELLLENFFYSLAPVVVRALLDPWAFKTLFLMLVEGLKEHKPESDYLKIHEEPSSLFVLLIVEDQNVKDSIYRAVQDLSFSSTELAHASIKTDGYFCLGYIYQSHDFQKRGEMQRVISQFLGKSR